MKRRKIWVVQEIASRIMQWVRTDSIERTYEKGVLVIHHPQNLVGEVSSVKILPSNIWKTKVLGYDRLQLLGETQPTNVIKPLKHQRSRQNLRIVSHLTSFVLVHNPSTVVSHPEMPTFFISTWLCCIILMTMRMNFLRCS